jgi:hypothetical protein
MNLQFSINTTLRVILSLTVTTGLDSESSCIVDRAEGRFEDMIMISYHRERCEPPL